jgi:hypothetical protein
VLASLTKIVKTSIQALQVGSSRPKNLGTATTGMNTMGNNICNFCSGPRHFIWECEVIKEFIRFGKCKRNPEGKVILPSGAQVPCSIPGAWMCDHIEEWHWQNPGQMAMQMYIEVMVVPPATAPLHVTAGQSYTSHPTTSVNLSPGSLPVGVYTL